MPRGTSASRRPRASTVRPVRPGPPAPARDPFPGSAGAQVLTTVTQAVAGDDPRDTLAPTVAANVHAGGNVLITADDATTFDGISGTAAGAGSKSVGASAAVDVIDKTTQAY